MFVGLWIAAGALANVSWTHSSGAPIQFSLVQGNIPERLKWNPREFAVTLNRYRRLTKMNWSSQVIVWPEAAIPAYAAQVRGDYLGLLERKARRHHAEVLLGVLTDNPSNGDAFNSVISLGGHDGVYNKRHLVPMAEYFPAPTWVIDWLEAHHLPYASFTPGAARQPLLQAAGYPLATSICYEDAFGSEIRRDLPEAAFLVNVTNDAWFGDSIALPQHFEISRMRALEFGRYLLRATNTGITAAVNPHGQVVTRLPEGVVGVLHVEAPPYAGRTPYTRFGNIIIVWLCAALISAGSVGSLGTKLR